MAEVSEVVRKLRTELGLSQEALAEKAGLLREEVSNVETGRNKASSARIRDGLARGFGLSLEDFKELVEGQLTVSRAKRLIQDEAGAA